MKKLIGISALLFSLNFYSQNIIDVYCSEDSCSHTLIDPEMLFVERWDTLPQSKFWKTVINTSKDTCLINIASTREILNSVDRKFWFNQSEDEKEFKDSVINYFCLDTSTKLYITTGKKRILSN